MKSLKGIVGEVKKGSVVKLFLARGESYVGQISAMTSKYVAVSSFSGRNSNGQRVYLDKPEFMGRKVLGYQEFTPGRSPTGRTVYVSVPQESPRELSDRDMGGFGGPFRGSFTDELIDERQREERFARARKKEEDDSQDHSIMHRDW